MVKPKYDANLRSEKFGLKTEEALKILSEDIEQLLNVYEAKYRNESIWTEAKQSFCKPSESLLPWFSLVLTLLSAVALIVIKYYATAVLLLAILVLTALLVIRENRLRRTELFRKIHLIVNEIELARKLCSQWTTENYPNLRSPMSPCVALQLTYRDGRLVNLPWALLARGDLIVIRPGQIAPSECTEIDAKRKFKANETYGLLQSADAPIRPIMRTPLPDLKCTLERTPFIENLKTILDKCQNRPSTIYNQQRHLLITKCIQFYGMVIFLSITLIFAGLHYNDMVYDDRPLPLKWMDLFIESTVSAILPILPLAFPLMWIAINLCGIAMLQTHISQPQPHTKAEQQRSFQEDLDTPTFEYEAVQLPFRDVLKNWTNVWRGYCMLLGRSANIVQVLGSITALCCVDKKGILSWPNPTPEKVFFLRDSADQMTSMDSDSTGSDTVQQSTEEQKKNDDANDNKTNKKQRTMSTANQTSKTSAHIIHPKTSTVAEVLDLTHDQHSPFRINFDDHEWKVFIDNLKPLGLAILVNTCCQQTQEHYSKFCAHVTAVATLDKDLVPVTNRYEIVQSQVISFMHGRCLCELAKQIGFVDQAREIFNFEGQIASYMHLQPEVVKRDIRFARQLRLSSKVKVPFPHCLSVLMRENQSNSLQMLTQGTADIVLDCCDDYWDGHDLKPLGPQERKRAQDFYQRNALTSYCTAFAYRPLRHGIYGALSETAYMELPPETNYRSAKAREHLFCTFDNGYTQSSSTPPLPNRVGLPHALSSDSLLFTENNKEDDVCDVEGCFEMQCHQVFIGMVTMQYQAQTDIVQLVERLDHASIRFVHFSKENELRSRVFSEKMGLESGWNCHISLLSDEQSSMSSPKNTSSNLAATGTEMQSDDDLAIDSELNKLLPGSLECSKSLSCSAPGAISDLPKPASSGSVESMLLKRRRVSKDSAMEEENCRSLSGFTDSTEQSAPINFDMSNRAKLPRGIENIRPHLENVDNVPLLVSLFTDCSAEATREMLSIMQSYGEIVVCLGSSASSANADIFLQADSSIAIEPLYPQVCQDIPAYTESNLLNNRHQAKHSDDNQRRKRKESLELEPTLFRDSSTISPIYLSRQLNAIPCSISICRDDSISILALIELSRRISNAFWSCVQFWACCGCSLAIMNVICACLSLPPLFEPIVTIYLMCVVVPTLSTSLVFVKADGEVMNRAPAKRHNVIEWNAFIYALGVYGCKFLPTVVIMILSYCSIMSHPLPILNSNTNDFYYNLETSRCFALYAIVLHFVVISISFVHRDYSIWQKNPFNNRIWMVVSFTLLFIQTLMLTVDLITNHEIIQQLTTRWPIVALLIASALIVFAIAEICKYEELKSIARYQRRARLDFGTKLGMNSPF